jgi:hypothetical protein
VQPLQPQAERAGPQPRPQRPGGPPGPLLSSEAETIIYVQPDILFTLIRTRLDIDFEGPLH